jgi:hypothetical protein
MKPSPGPWKIHKRGPDCGFIINITPANYHFSIAQVIDSGCKEKVNQYNKENQEQAANARLIALAPDMLEAIAKAYEEHERGSQVVARQIIAAVYNKAMDAGLL